MPGRRWEQEGDDERYREKEDGVDSKIFLQVVSLGEGSQSMERVSHKQRWEAKRQLGALLTICTTYHSAAQLAWWLRW